MFHQNFGSMQNAPPQAHHQAQAPGMMNQTQATDQMLLTELQKRRCADPAVIQHAAAAFSLLNMVEGMLSYPQQAPPNTNPAGPAVPSTRGAENMQAPQQAVSQPRAAEQPPVSAVIQGSTEDLLRNVQKKNSEMRSLLTGQVRTCTCVCPIDAIVRAMPALHPVHASP